MAELPAGMTMNELDMMATGFRYEGSPWSGGGDCSHTMGDPAVANME